MECRAAVIVLNICRETARRQKIFHQLLADTRQRAHTHQCTIHGARLPLREQGVSFVLSSHHEKLLDIKNIPPTPADITIDGRITKHRIYSFLWQKRPNNKVFQTPPYIHSVYLIRRQNTQDGQKINLLTFVRIFVEY